MLNQTWYNTWQDVTEEDIEKVGKLLSKGTLSIIRGGVLQQFEKRFSSFAGTDFAVSTNNGTSALYCALKAVGVEAGDDVLVCDYGFHAMAAAVVSLGARVIPCDMTVESLTIDPEDLAKKITNKTKTILVHNPWGVPADFDAIRKVTDLPLISDASHAHGATYKNQPIATYADITCFSLGHSKLITGGELGCAVTNNEKLRDKMLIIGHVNRVPADLKSSDWQGNAIGLKFRPHPVALTLALSQLKRFDEKKQKLIETCSKIEKEFSQYGFIPQRVPEDSERVYWRIVMRLDESKYGGMPTESIEEQLKQGGLPVEANHYWPSLQNQSIFAWPGHEKHIQKAPCSRVQATTPRLITLPAPVVLPDEELNKTNITLKGLHILTQGCAATLGGS